MNKDYKYKTSYKFGFNEFSTKLMKKFLLFGASATLRTTDL